MITGRGVSFEMPKAQAYDLHRWDENLEEHDVDGEVTIESGDAQNVVTLTNSNLAAGDLTQVETVHSSLGGSGSHRMFRIADGPDGDLTSRLERETDVFTVDQEGTWRNASGSVHVSPRGELAIEDGTAAPAAFVARIIDRDGSRVMKWSITDSNGSATNPQLEFDIRAYETTEGAYDAIRRANDRTSRTVVEVPDEAVVGVVVEADGGPYILAVTELSGAFESFQSPRDLALTIAAGTEPELFHQAAVQARLGGLNLADMLVSATNLETPSASQVRHQLDPALTPKPPDAVSQEQHVSWSPNSETFRAVVVDLDQTGRPTDEPTVFGTGPQQFVTAASLIRAMGSAGVDVSIETGAALLDIEAKQDGPRIVGVQTRDGPRLALVSESHNVERLEGNGEHSPNGPNWGSAGNGPRETVSILVERVCGAPVDAPAAKDRLLNEVVSGLSVEFSMRAKDISSFIDGGPKPTVETGTREIGLASKALEPGPPSHPDADIRSGAAAIEVDDLSL